MKRKPNIKTEHSGAKHGGSGFYGHHRDAKEECKVARRHNDEVEIMEQVIDMDEDEWTWWQGYNAGAAVVFGLIGMAEAIKEYHRLRFIRLMFPEFYP
jgi:hypothetical protein